MKISKRYVALGLCTLGLLVPGAASTSAQELDLGTRVGPPRGSLVLAGGGTLSQDIYTRIIELAGGPDALIIVMPTAGGADRYDETYRPYVQLRDAGARNLTIVHTKDRVEADTERFVAPLRRAAGVFFGGGEQALLADTYLHTRTHRELQAVLDRGGVVSGNSAGAHMLASFLTRANIPLTSPVIIGDHIEGFGFLRNVAIDAHLLRENRQFDLLQVIARFPHLLGIGIDLNTAIVVRQDAFDVIGHSQVAIYDNQRSIPPNGGFYFLAPGDSYNLATREPARGPARDPIVRVEKANVGKP